MYYGRRICNHLKKIRKRIAEENGIILDQEKCTHKGDCMGTCPRCEAELQYIEHEIKKRKQDGQIKP